MKITELREVRSERFIHYPGNETLSSEIERLRKARTNEKIEERFIFVVQTRYQLEVANMEEMWECIKVRRVPCTSEPALDSVKRVAGEEE